jgi:ribosomal protein S18 acetylase RimI-like enzyme
MSGTDVRIVDFLPRQRDAFRLLNLEWLEALFEVEPVDEKILSDPEAIIASGGSILYALRGSEVLGCCALKHQGEGIYELTKMAVTTAVQGSGIGRMLGVATIDRFIELRGRKLYLETHDSLVPAIRLYESLGFEHTDPPFRSPYARSNVYMVYRKTD